jgi:hypothetical protein
MPTLDIGDQASVHDRGGEVRFVVEDADPATARLLAAQAYTEADGRFEKRFRRDDLLFPHDFRAIEARWIGYLREAPDRRATPATVDRALAWVADHHAEAGIDWWLTGSAALYVRGIDLLPHDIDVMAYLRQAEAVGSVVAPSIVEPFQRVSDWVVKGFGVIDRGIRVDYAFEPEAWVDGQGIVDFGPTAEQRLEEVHWRGRVLRVPEVTTHLWPNEVRGRLDRVALIRAYLRRGEGEPPT